MPGIPCRVVRFQAPTALRGVAIAGALLAALMFMFGVLVVTDRASELALGPFVVGAWCLAPAAAVAFMGRPQHGAQLEILGNILRFRVGGRRRVVRIGEVEGSYVVAETNTLVLLLQSGGKVEVELDGVPAADVLRTFGLDLERRALSAPLRGMLGAFTKGLVTFTMVLTAALAALGPVAQLWTLLLAPLLATLATVLVLRVFGSPRVVVGADGLRVKGALRTVFVPFSEVTGVSTASATVEDGGGRGITVERRGNRALFLPTVGQSVAQSAALVGRIREGMTRFGAAGARPLAALERNGRRLTEWKQDLERWITAGGGFRDPALGKDDLERVLSDASAPAERRIGAALALRVADDSAAARIRVVAETCANEELRAALEEVADDAVDEGTLERLR